MSTLKIEEGRPDRWPDGPDGLSQAAEAIEPEIVWRRLEAWISYRWGARSCSFLVEGGRGSWRPPLVPFVAETVQDWRAGAWEAVTLRACPLGGFETGSGTYRVTGVLGAAGRPPADVLEAYRRLAEYLASAQDAHPAVTSYTTELGGGMLRESFDRPANWLARAMSLSGAADILRGYRRAP